MAGPGIQQKLESATCDVDGVIEHRGHHDASGLTFGVVAARYNTALTSGLTREIVNTLVACGATPSAITVVWVPGAFEIPATLKALADQSHPDALIAVGAVIQGETSHADTIVSAVTRSLIELSQNLQVPVLDGVVEAPSHEIARVRCLPGESSRGQYLARAAVETVRVRQALQGGSRHG